MSSTCKVETLAGESNDSSRTFLALVKESTSSHPLERYVFVWDCGQDEQLIQQFGRFAANPELSFNWRDAAVLSLEVRKVQNS